LEKSYSFQSEDTVRIDYVLTNLSDSSFSFLWAAHPLFQAREGMKLQVPEDSNEIEIAYSKGKRLGQFGDRIPWPIMKADEGNIDLSILGAPDQSVADKYYFSGKLTVGWATLSDLATGESIALRFPEDKVPYLGVWANSGGYGGFNHFAIEPATGRMDDLNHAIRHHEAATVEGQGTYHWFLEVTLT
jgi:galactose mutarotase-like enzyme